MKLKKRSYNVPKGEVQRIEFIILYNGQVNMWCWYTEGGYSIFKL